MTLLGADRIRRRAAATSACRSASSPTPPAPPPPSSNASKTPPTIPTRPLAVVARLADVLALPRAALWHDPDPAPQSDPPAPEANEAGDAGDAAAVGALLAKAGTLTAVEALADALNWALERPYAAIDDLDRRTHPLGWTIQRTKGDVAICRRDDAADPEQLQELLKHHHARRGLSITEARLLFDIRHGRAEQRITGNNDRVALARLHNAGLIEDADQLELAEDVRFSLLLDEPAG
jgi:hypothetical protein